VDDAAAQYASLRRLLAEAVILQDAATELLRRIQQRPDPAEIAGECGRITGRFIELRGALDSYTAPGMNRYTGALRQILCHHVLLLKMTRDLLAGAAHSEALDRRLDDVDSLGAPGRQLEDIRMEVLALDPER
jgi:hypothetical protein